MTTKAFQAVDLCNKCGFCQAGCPVYKVTGIEWTTARGRVALIKDVLDGALELDEDMREPLFNCLTCNGCVDHCPPGVPTADIVVSARRELLKRHGQPWVEHLLFRRVLPQPSLLAAAGRALRLGQLIGVQALASNLPFAGDLSTAADVLPRIPAGTDYATLRKAARPLDKPKYRVAYFVGCAAANLSPDVAMATIRVLHRHQAEVVVPEFGCCGKPAESYGDLEGSLLVARKNVNLAEHLTVDAVVTACGTCSAFLKSYGKLLEDDELYAGKAAAFSAKVRDTGEFLTQIGLHQEMGALKGKVTWHDPCHLGRFQKLAAQPREILRSIPGLEFVELPEASMCCGGAGSYGVTHHEISARILARKMDNVARTGAGILATSCPACSIQLSYGVRKHGLPARTVELMLLLDEAYRAAPGP